MCKYINFNNLRKKKEFVSEGVVVGWAHLCGDTKRRKRKYEKQSIILTVKKIIKTFFFIVFKKMVFENTKNKNIPLSPNKFFVFFSQEQKTVFKNMNQICP